MIRLKTSAGNSGFTFIELVITILIIAVLAAVAFPRMSDLGGSARIASLNAIAGAMRSTVSLVQTKARASGLVAAPQNPGGSNQTLFVVDFPFGSTEVDWRNLCPESMAEVGDRLTMLDFISLSGPDINTMLNNQYTLVGYDIPGFGVPTNQGCYVIYDSFGDPDCTVTVVTVDC